MDIFCSKYGTANGNSRLIAKNKNGEIAKSKTKERKEVSREFEVNLWR